MLELGDLGVLSRTFGLVFCRVMASIVSLPLLGSRYVPARLKIVVGFTISVFVFGTQALKSTEMEGQWFSLVYSLCTQVVIGFGIGFLVHAFWEVFMMLGDIISHQSGLSFAHLIDPSSGMGTPLLSQFYILFLNMIFLSVDGHLAIVACIIESFQILPINATLLINIDILLSTLTWIFDKALQIALPSIAALWIVNIAFGMMARVAPQLNIFSIGFIFSLLAGLSMMWITLFWMDGHIERCLSDAILAIKSYSGGAAYDR